MFKHYFASIQRVSEVCRSDVNGEVKWGGKYRHVNTTKPFWGGQFFIKLFTGPRSTPSGKLLRHFHLQRKGTFRTLV